MIVLAPPYVSPHFIRTVRANHWPVLRNHRAETVMGLEDPLLLDETRFIARYERDPDTLVYTNSEDELDWITTHLQRVKDAAERMKNKAAFRQMMSAIDPEFQYREMDLETLLAIEPAELHYPCVVKPVLGIANELVHICKDAASFVSARQTIAGQVKEREGIYPESVLHFESFIVEDYIDGDSYVVDAYYDKRGKPIILNIVQHIDTVPDDVSDTLYITSADIIEGQYQSAYNLLERVGHQMDLRNFPVVAEIRVGEDGMVRPIEINPLRFNGWSQSEIAWYAYGLNIYEAYFEREEPNWQQLLTPVRNKVFSMLTFYTPTDLDPKRIRGIREEALRDAFANILCVRPMEYRRFPFFAYVFVEATENQWREEIESVLKRDYRDFLHLAPT